MKFSNTCPTPHPHLCWVSIKMLASVLKILSLGVHTYETPFWENACCQFSTIHTTSIQPNCMLILLKTSVSIVAEKYCLRSIP
mmetsp:Transcript_17659/g.38270  ORF Transcript_17659/g.38270 Transcript_17659/m.38270 type:complete len:83 (-) Transcript_17659:814-1062(-)